MVKAVCLPLFALLVVGFGIAISQDARPPQTDPRLSPTLRFLGLSDVLNGCLVEQELQTGKFQAGQEWQTVYTLDLTADREYALVAVWGRDAREVGMQILDAEKEVVVTKWQKAHTVHETRAVLSEPITQVVPFQVNNTGRFTIRLRLREAKDMAGECPCLYALFRGRPESGRQRIDRYSKDAPAKDAPK